MKTIIYFLSVVLFTGGLLIGCNKAKKADDPYENSRKIYDQAIEIHDEVMPKMGQIMQLQKSLKDSRDGLTDEPTKMKVDSTINDLENAYDRMMTWMRNIPDVPEFNPNVNSGEMKDESFPDPDELERSQRQSLEEIKRVKININESIEEAEKLSESLKGF